MAVLSWFRTRAQERRTAVDLYGAIVTRARRPDFFARHGVEDTPEGRAAMLIVVLYPVLARLQRGEARHRRIARYLTEAYVTDIDDCLREMGVGDTVVPKKVKRAAHALGERCQAYQRASAGPEPLAVLAAELAANVPGLSGAGGASAIAGELIHMQKKLEASSVDDLLDPSRYLALSGAREAA